MIEEIQVHLESNSLVIKAQNYNIDIQFLLNQLSKLEEENKKLKDMITEDVTQKALLRDLNQLCAKYGINQPRAS